MTQFNIADDFDATPEGFEEHTQCNSTETLPARVRRTRLRYAG